MADHSPILLSPHHLLLLLCIVSASCLIAAVKSDHQSFIFPPSTGIELAGNASFSGNPHRSIQLTNNRNLRFRAGWATYYKELPLWDNSSRAIVHFNTTFHFIMGKSINHDFGGDGIAFFLSSFGFEMPKNSPGEGLGLFSPTTDGNPDHRVVAVEFDTFKNSDDPDNNHVGINVNSVNSTVTVSLRTVSITLRNVHTWKAWIDYSGEAHKLEVFLAPNPLNDFLSKPGSPILCHDIDLSRYLPPDIKVGLSASMGDVAGTQEVVFWNFSSGFLDSNGTTPPKRNNVSIILVSVLALTIGLCAFLIFWHRRRRSSKLRGEEGQQSDVELDEWFAQGPRRLSYADLVVSTNNFSEENKLGEGGFGGVYRGILPSTNETVAVKRISQGSKQGKKEYVSEVTIISKLRHRNLVQLLGWCHQRGELFLVYEFLPNGSLDKFLFGEKENTHLDWGRRYSVACDVASALVYLHEDWDQRVVHRDIKSSNVMLDCNFSAKLGDFGLARIVERDLESSNTTVVAGTFGYLAPEYAATGKASPESDVFSFGALCLEIACGKLPVDRSLTRHNSRLVEWVWYLYGKGKILDAADEKLRGDFNEEEMKQLMVMGLLCSHPDPRARPTMRQVLKILKFEVQIPNVPPNFLVEGYGDASSPDVHSLKFTSMGSESSSSSSVMTASSSSASRGSNISRPLKCKKAFYSDA